MENYYDANLLEILLLHYLSLLLYRFVRSGNGRLVDCELISYLYYVSFHLLKIRIIYRRSSIRKFIFSSINVYFESTLIFKKL